MATESATTSLSPVDFHGQTLFLVERDGQPFTPMKPIVEGMGLDWAGQFTKLKEKSDRFCIAIIPIQMPGDDQNRDVLFMPLRKLPAWLLGINPKKVRPAIRKKVTLYQKECDDALWDYWTKGQATNPRAALPSQAQAPTPAVKPRKPRLIPITKYVLKADVMTGVKAYAAAQGREPDKWMYREFLGYMKSDANAYWDGLTDDKAVIALKYTRERFDRFIANLKGAPVDWRPISEDGKHVISRAAMREDAKALAAPVDAHAAMLPPADYLATQPAITAPTVPTFDDLPEAEKSRRVIMAQMDNLDKVYSALDDYLYESRRIIAAEADKLTKGLPAGERAGRKAIAAELRTNYGNHTHAMLAAVNSIRAVLRVTATSSGLILPAKGRAKPIKAKAIPSQAATPSLPA